MGTGRTLRFLRFGVGVVVSLGLVRLESPTVEEGLGVGGVGEKVEVWLVSFGLYGGVGWFLRGGQSGETGVRLLEVSVVWVSEGKKR